MTGASTGFLERVHRTPTGLEISGWAASTSAPASRVLIFAGGTLLAQTAPAAERPDVAKGRSPTTLRSGFSVEVPSPPGVSADDVEAVALIGDQVFTLPRL